MFLSIDLEEFNHDLKRSLNIRNTEAMKTDVLWSKYNLIDSFLKKFGGENGRYCTFFCTGCIAEKDPDLIRKISTDGHEIASHSYYHDNLHTKNSTELEVILKRSKDALESAAGKEVLGFRAPRFLLNKDTVDQYKIIEKIFKYDSSFCCQTINEKNIFQRKYNLSNIKLFPIYKKKFLNKSISFGGTFFKLYPRQIIQKLINSSLKNNIEPHIYLHPYELNNSKDLKVKYHELKDLGLGKSIYYYLRQHQWISIGNSKVLNKLEMFVNKYPLKGKLCDYL